MKTTMEIPSFNRGPASADDVAVGIFAIDHAPAYARDQDRPQTTDHRSSG